MSARRPPRFSIDLAVAPDWANAERLRTAVGSCMLAMSCDPDASRAVALVTAELAENAIKYGAFDDTSATFRVNLTGADGRVSVVVESPAAAGDEHAARLFSMLSWIEGFRSGDDAFRARLLEIAKVGGPPSSSRLGLVRLVYEASCTLRAEIDGGVLRVTAEMPL